MERNSGDNRRTGDQLLNPMSKLSSLKTLRIVAIAEGISFLLLLFVAMPLKYLADMPEAVNIIGWAHGALFVAFLLLALVVKINFEKNFLWLVKAFIAAILPLGSFIFEKHLRIEERRYSEFLQS